MDEYKEINEKEKDREIDIETGTIKQIDEETGIENTNFKTLIESFSKNYEEGNISTVFEDIDKFEYLLENSSYYPIDLFNDEDISSFFLLILQDEKYKSIFSQVLSILTTLLSCVDFNGLPLCKVECFSIYEDFVLPQIKDIQILFTFYQQLTNQNGPASLSFFRSEVFKKVFDLILPIDAIGVVEDVDLFESGMKLILNSIIALIKYVSEYQQNDEQQITFDTQESAEINEYDEFKLSEEERDAILDIIKEYQMRLVEFLLQQVNEREYLNPCLLHICFTLLFTNIEDVVRDLLKHFPRKLIFTSFASEDPLSMDLSLRILKLLIMMKDIQIISKWDFSIIFENIESASDKIIIQFCDILTFCCKSFLSFNKYILTSGEINHVLNFIENGSFQVKDYGLRVIEAIVERRVPDFIKYLILDVDYVEKLAVFLDNNAGNFISYIVKAINNLVILQSEGVQSDLIVRAIIDNEILEKIDEIRSDIQDSNIYASIECLSYVLTSLMVENEQ